ncbi:hypothetical protein MJ8_29760 [Mesorhizobium sp. J8]|nr:hypothetical protein MJ8_29760 [Mesorhizobium sp. J8]
MGAAIRAILLSDWDPLLVRDVSVAQDEYDAYVGPLIGLIERKAPVSAVRDYLLEVERGSMGLIGDEKRALAVAGLLTELKEAS